MVGIDGNSAGTAEGLHGEWRVRAHNFDLLVFGFTVGVDAQIDRHAEQVEVLRNLSGHAETLVAAEAVGGVFQFEFGRARGIEPLGKEPSELLAVVFLGELAEVVHAGGLSGELGRKLAHGLQIFVFAHHPAQHVQDHGSFVGGQRLKFGGK